jgi:MFS family permease
MSLNRYKWFVVGMLWCVCFFDYVDRWGISSLFPLLKKEMHLSLVQLGLLGSVSAWIYGLGAPFAGLVVDRIRRKTAVLGGLFIWSGVTAAATVSHSFRHLLWFMAALGATVTIYMPAAMSMISDYHGKATRSRAMGIHQTAVYTGTIGGGFLAGWIGERCGWRWSFILFGAVGVMLALALLGLLREPERGAADLDGGSPKPQAPGLGRVQVLASIKLVLGTPTAVLLMGAFMCANFVALVLLAWMPNFIYDKFHMSAAMAGLSATLFAQVASMVGSPLGGWLADIFRRRWVCGRVLVQAVAVFCGAPFVFFCGRAGSITAVIAMLTAWGLFKGLYDANIFASVFDVIPPQVRGTAAGFINMMGWLGGGAAPVVVGFVAERIGASRAISFSSAVYVAAGLLLTTGSALFIRRDVAQLEKLVGTGS